MSRFKTWHPHCFKEVRWRHLLPTLARGAFDDRWPDGCLAPDRLAIAKWDWHVEGPHFCSISSAIHYSITPLSFVLVFIAGTPYRLVGAECFFLLLPTIGPILSTRTVGSLWSGRNAQAKRNESIDGR